MVSKRTWNSCWEEIPCSPPSLTAFALSRTHGMHETLRSLTSNKGDRKGWFYAEFPALRIRGSIFGSSYSFQAVLFPHKSLPQLLLPPPLPPISATEKDASSWFWRGLFWDFLVCIKTPMYLCVYRHFSILCTHSICLHTDTFFKTTKQTLHS